MPNVIGKDGIIVGYLRPLTELHNDWQTGARCWILAETPKSVLHMDGVDDRLVDKLNGRIRIEIGRQTAGNGQQGECIDQYLEQTELQPAVGNIGIGALAPIDDLREV